MKRTLEQVAPKLARSIIARKAIREEFGVAKAERMFAKMKAADFEGPDGYAAHNFLVDQVPNAGKVVWEALFEDEWPISVICYGGVYLIQAVDHDDIGYFDDKDDAVDHARGNWLGL
jgi:hypothetical protein